MSKTQNSTMGGPQEKAQPAQALTPTDKPKLEELPLLENGLPAFRTASEQSRYAEMWWAKGIVSAKNFSNPRQVMAAIQTLSGMGLVVPSAIRSCMYDNGAITIFGDLPLAIVRKSNELDWIEERDLCLEPVYSEEEYAWSVWVIEQSNQSLLDFVMGDKVEAKNMRLQALKIKMTPKTRKQYRVQSAENNNLHLKTVANVCAVKRRSDAKPCVSFFTHERAVTAGLANKKGPWQTYPHIMLMRRARGVALQKAFSDVLHCVAQDIDVESVPEAPQNRRLREKLQAEEGIRVLSPAEREAHIEGHLTREAKATAQAAGPKAQPSPEEDRQAFEEEMAMSYDEAVERYGGNLDASGQGSS